MRPDRPLVLNLWHLKNTNGMFYYAVDYARSLQRPATLLLHPRLQGVSAAMFGDLPILRLDLWGYFKFFLQLLARSGGVFTPTPHPLPFLGRQIVVVHDSYPFRGRAG